MFDEMVLPYLKLKLNVIQITPKKGVLLIYDNRFYKHVETGWPEVCVILDQHENILKKGNFDICLPFSQKTFVPNLPPEEKLNALLKITKNVTATNYKELKTILNHLHLEKDACVPYFWKITNINCRYGEYWIHPAKASYPFYFEAFLKSDYTVGFRKNTDYLDALKMEQIEKNRKPKRIPPPPKPREKETCHAFQKNSSTSVNVKLTSLNEFYNTSGMCLEKWTAICQKLGETIAVLWVELDDKNNARYVTYKDKFMQEQIDLSHQQEWKTLFDLVWNQREKMMKEKTTILQEVLDELNTKVSHQKDVFKKCLTQLNVFIKNFKVLVYSPNDFVLHALKLQFAFYMNEKKNKGFRGIVLNPDAKNNLAMLKTTEIVFYNFFNYLELEKTPDFVCQDMPVLYHHLKTLIHHPLQKNNMRTLNYLSQRGVHYAFQLFSAWQSFGNQFLSNFQFDIFSLPFLSLPCLSYKALWTSYSKKASFYHHGIEKTKTFDVNLLRQYCQGGYSFSAKLKKEALEPLTVDPNNVCKNIQSYDIKSSYGYACSELSAIKGFCTSYQMTEHGTLKRCDIMSRSKTFEFLSVFFTIYILETFQKLTLKTVYSNYSQNGIFWVEKYPLDLAVVTQAGQLFLFNFDGQFCHSCRKSCPDLKSYVQNKTKEELQKASEKRDVIIQHWCDQLNQSKEYCVYKVLTDCHDPAYQKKNLIHFFHQTPLLLPLISDYIEKKEMEMQDVLFANNNLTFLALIQGHVPSPNVYHPLLIRESHQWSRSSHTFQKSILMSRDYLMWLQNKFNFQVTHIEKVWFYKKCTVLNGLFKDLIYQRALLTTSSSQKQFLKNIVNMCAGFFGYNNLKSQSTVNVRLVTHLSKTTEPYNTEIIPAGHIENTNFVILKKYAMKNLKMTSSTTPLPLFCFVIEFGKLRLSQAFCFFETYLIPNTFQFVYSQVDNLTFILTTETLEEAVQPDKKKAFEQEQSTLFGSFPGMLTKEFEFTSQDKWQYITSMEQNYAILASQSDKNVHKNNGLNQISSEMSYQASLKILNREKCLVVQNRRLDKMSNTDMQTVTLCYADRLR